MMYLKPRVPTPTGQKDQAESEIQKAIISLVSPHCVMLSRINSGLFKVSMGGKSRWLRTFRIYLGGGTKECDTMTYVDLFGFLADGRPLAIEVKKKGERVSDAQANFLALIRGIGGVAGVCYSTEDAQTLIDDANEEEWTPTDSRIGPKEYVPTGPAAGLSHTL